MNGCLFIPTTAARTEVAVGVGEDAVLNDRARVADCVDLHLGFRQK